MHEHTNNLAKMIARFTAQRACIDQAACELANIPHHGLKFSLGKARTYDRFGLKVALAHADIGSFDPERDHRSV